MRDANLDRDEKRVYSFIVRANDLGDENFGEATVTITLNDVNDKDPIFTSDETDEIEEEQGIGTGKFKLDLVVSYPWRRMFVQ